MVRWLGILLRTFRSAVRTRRELALENLALRQQLAVWKAREPRPRLTEMDLHSAVRAAAPHRMGGITSNRTPAGYYQGQQ